MTIPRTPKHCLQPVLPGFICFFMLMAAPQAASATDGYAQLWGGLNLANANAASEGGLWGPGAQLGARFGISDFWSIVGGVEGSYHFETDDAASTEVLGLFGGFRYNLDVFQYIPYVGLSIENFIVAPPDEPQSPDQPDQAYESMVGGKFSVGVDWRYSREWSVGGMIELHAPLVDPTDFPVYSTIGLNLAYHFRL
jgi:hypothetical protein